MTEYLQMTQKEIDRGKILQGYIDKKIKTQKEAAKIIDVGERHFRRILKNYQQYGEKGLIHQGRGTISNRRLAEKKQKKIETICLEPQYYDFGPTLMTEKLEEIHNIKISVETVRRIMGKIGIRQIKERKNYKQYIKRLRRANQGAMIQFDGSYHKRFEERNGGEVDCLLLAVDDATSKIMYAKFDDNEGKKAVFVFRKEYIRKYGAPREIYLDKFSTYKSNYNKATYEPDTPTEFGKSCAKVGIKLISAHSPQAKGRVEVKNKTLQDRLIKEMRLLGINDVKSANKYLEEEFVPLFNEKFGKEANGSLDLHRELTQEENNQLDWIFSLHSNRVIANDYTISYKSEYYQLYKGKIGFYPKLRVEIEEQFNGIMRILFRGNEVKHEKLKYKPVSLRIVSEIDTKESEAKRKQKEKRDKERYDNSKKMQKRYNYFKMQLQEEGLVGSDLHKEASRRTASCTV